MVNDIVKYGNGLNSVPFRRFNEREFNLFFSVISRLKNKGSQEITLTFEDLKRLSKNKRHGTEFLEDIKNTYQKVFNLSMWYEDELVYKQLHLFRKFEINKEKYNLTVSIEPEATPLLNELKQWTRFSLEQFTHLKSTYSKTLFRLLKQYRTIGQRKFQMEEFRLLLDIPKSYRVNNIDERVLKPIKEELTPIFKGLNIKKLHGGRGGKIIGYQFSWKPESNNEDDFSKSSWYEMHKKITNIESNSNLTEKEKSSAKKRIYRNYSKKTILQKESLPAKNEKPQISEEERLRLRREIDERLEVLGMNKNDSDPLR